MLKILSIFLPIPSVKRLDGYCSNRFFIKTAQIDAKSVWV